MLALHQEVQSFPLSFRNMIPFRLVQKKLSILLVQHLRLQSLFQFGFFSNFLCSDSASISIVCFLSIADARARRAALFASAFKVIIDDLLYRELLRLSIEEFDPTFDTLSVGFISASTKLSIFSNILSVTHV